MTDVISVKEVKKENIAKDDEKTISLICSLIKNMMKSINS